MIVNDSFNYHVLSLTIVHDSLSKSRNVLASLTAIPSLLPGAKRGIEFRDENGYVSGEKSSYCHNFSDCYAG